MMSDNVITTQQRPTPFVSRSMPFTMDGKMVQLECITTEHGDMLVLALDYVAAFTGCAPKDASNKLSSLYNFIPQLRPPKQELRSFSKVCIYILIDTPFYDDLTPSVYTGCSRVHVLCGP